MFGSSLVNLFLIFVTHRFKELNFYLTDCLCRICYIFYTATWVGVSILQQNQMLFGKVHCVKSLQFCYYFYNIDPTVFGKYLMVQQTMPFEFTKLHRPIRLDSNMAV